MKERVCNNDKIIVTNIQRMCMHDGPGIRTTVFVKGCNLHCPWCANPENINSLPQSYIMADGREGIYGAEYSTDELYEIVIKDSLFWKNGGGVTFSGGEPLLQAHELIPLLMKLKEKNIHIVFETALMTKKELLLECQSFVDLFIVDIKLLEHELCKKVLGGNIRNFWANLSELERLDKSVIFRIPCNKEYTLKQENIVQIKECLKRYSHCSVEIFATHSLAKSKYESLGLECLEWKQITDKELESVADELQEYAVNVLINRL